MVVSSLRSNRLSSVVYHPSSNDERESAMRKGSYYQVWCTPFDASAGATTRLLPLTPYRIHQETTLRTHNNDTHHTQFVDFLSSSSLRLYDSIASIWILNHHWVLAKILVEAIVHVSTGIAKSYRKPQCVPSGLMSRTSSRRGLS